MASAAQNISFSEGWGELKRAIDKILVAIPYLVAGNSEAHYSSRGTNSGNRQPTNRLGSIFSPEEYFLAYNACYSLCTQRDKDGNAAALYDSYVETFRNHLQATFSKDLKSKTGLDLLNAMVIKYQEFKILYKWMNKIFMYLDRFYVKQSAVSNLQTAAYSQFRNEVYGPLRADFTEAMLTLIEKDRNGDLIDAVLLRECLSVFVELSRKPGSDLSSSFNGSGTRRSGIIKGESLGEVPDDVFIEDFQKPLLERSKLYFSDKGKMWLRGLSTSEFLVIADEALAAEKDRAIKFFQPAAKSVSRLIYPDIHPEADEGFDRGDMGTLPKLVKVFQDKVLAENEVDLLAKEGSGLKYMLQHHKKPDLALLFQLYKPLDGCLAPIGDELKTHVITEGRQFDSASKKTEDIVRLVSMFIELHEKYESLVKVEFENNNTMARAMKEAFEEFLNDDKEDEEITFAEMLATFIDQQLKSTRLDDNSRQNSLEKSTILFQYLQEKDRFAEIYRVQLSKRLLNNEGEYDITFEKMMITTFKASTGAGFTSRMEGMIKDLLTNKNGQVEFQKYCADNNIGDRALADPSSVNIGDVSFSVNQLTTGWWPSSTLRLDLKYPEEMMKCIAAYEQYFTQNNDHKVLKWDPTLGSCVVRAKLGGRNLEMTLTTLQAAAISLFNNPNPLHFREIQESLGVDETVCKKVLHSFWRYNILKKEGSDNDKKIDPQNDIFSVDEQAPLKKTKFKVPMPSLEESHNPEKVTEDRKHIIEAAIVRIMKARKNLDHHGLVAEVIKQLQIFKPTPKQIKDRIETLIERDYLERDEGNSQMYKYMA